MDEKEAQSGIPMAETSGADDVSDSRSCVSKTENDQNVNPFNSATPDENTAKVDIPIQKDWTMASNTITCEPSHQNEIKLSCSEINLGEGSSKSGGANSMSFTTKTLPGECSKHPKESKSVTPSPSKKRHHHHSNRGGHQRHYRRSNSEPRKIKGRHRAGRNRRGRRWKPYSKLTWEERRQLDERNARRAQRLRDEWTAHGLTLAPLNTTQFLIQDHQTEKPDYEAIYQAIQSLHRKRTDSGATSSDDFYSSPEDEDEYQRQQFEDEYAASHDEYLSELPKMELAEEYMGLEDKIEGIEKRLKDIREQNEVDQEAEVKIQVFREEIQKLSEENNILWRKNLRLVRHISSASKDLQ